jgi:Novel STAND NTPase 1
MPREVWTIRQTQETIEQNLAERLCWQAARLDDARVARRLYRKHVVDGVYRLDKGALLDDFINFLQKLGVLDPRADVQSRSLQREMVPVVQYILLDGVKIPVGIASMKALLSLLFSNEALMQLVGFNAQQVRHGVCQRGAAKRQHPRIEGPICPDILANNIVQLNLRDLVGWQRWRRQLLEQSRGKIIVFAQEWHGIIPIAEFALLANDTVRIEAPFLQLALTRLWDEETQANSHILRFSTLERLGGAQEIVRTHLDGVMSRLDAIEPEVCSRFFDRLVTPSGSKIARSLNDLTKWAGTPSDHVP